MDNSFMVISADLDRPFALKSASLEMLKDLHGLDAFPSGTGEGGATISVTESAVTVPWFARGIILRADAVASMPYTIMNGDTDVTESPDLMRITSNLRGLLWHTEADLVMFGASYWLKQSNILGGNVTPRWVANHTIQIETDPRKGLVGFRRTVNGDNTVYPVEKFVYFWVPSYDNEVGPGYGPGRAALEAAGVLRNTDRMVAAYFKRGAIRPTIFGVPPGTAQTEVDNLGNWFDRRVSGIQNAFKTLVLRILPGMAPIMLGDALKDTEAPELTEKKREDVATALGIPQSLLWSSSAYATARHEDRLTFIEQTVVPQCLNIHEEVLNDQLFNPEGLELRFHPEKLPIMQDAQLDKATALAQLVGVGVAVLTPDEAREMMGKEPLTQPKTAQPDAVQAASQEMKLWQAMAVKRFKEGHPEKALAFKCKHIPSLKSETIMGALEAAKNIDDVRSAFTWANYP